MASLMRYSRNIGPSAARPSPLREKGVRPAALELDVTEHTIAPFEFAEQNGAPVTELRHETTELVSRVRHCDGICIVRQLISGEEFRRLALDDVRVQPKLLCQRSIEDDQLRVRDGRRLDAGVEPGSQRGIAMDEIYSHGGYGMRSNLRSRVQLTSAAAVPSRRTAGVSNQSGWRSLSRRKPGSANRLSVRRARRAEALDFHSPGRGRVVG